MPLSGGTLYSKAKIEEGGWRKGENESKTGSASSARRSDRVAIIKAKRKAMK
jgi:hypothetical protein